jgi:serine/threonine protein kinase
MTAERTGPTHQVNGVAPELTSRVIGILESYLTDLERGRPPDPDDLAAQHPDLSDVLRAYLEKLDALHQAASGLRPLIAPEVPTPLRALADQGRLGDFRILREVGRGGMGIVYEAEQISLRRRVALKVLPLAAALEGRQLERFKNEAQAAAHLHHSHIVPVHAVGCERGFHYYAMQFIEGRNLATMIDELRHQAGLTTHEGPPSRGGGSGLTGGLTSPPPVAADAPASGCSDTLIASLATQTSGRGARDRTFFHNVAQLGVQAAEALDHAHLMGVIHRDIKPANLMVDARVHLWITDFGLALCQGGGGLTLTGDLVGTLRYMSPEQALARPCLIDQRTDIYSLGVTLYELLTLEPAYPGQDRQEVLRRIAFEDPRPMRQLNPAIPRELETVIQKAMAKEPEERYATAQDLSDDLRRFLEHKPVLARRPTIRQRLTKWARRHRPLVFMAAVLVVLAVAALVAGTVLIWKEKAETQAALAQARAKEEEAQVQRERAEANFRSACEGVTQLLLRLEEKRWAHVPEFIELRQALAEQSLEFFQQFLNENSTDPAMRAQTGKAYLVVASVYGMRGKQAETQAAYRKAIDLFEHLAMDFPDNPRFWHLAALGCHILGLEMHEHHQCHEAIQEFDRALAHFEQALERDGDALLQNDFAWFRATCPQLRYRNAGQAVRLARQAVAGLPKNGTIWNTLGVAYYRHEQWQAAVDALRESVRLRSGGDSCDWFFLAMAYWQLGQKEEARRWYKEACQEVQRSNLSFEPLARYRDEATDLLYGKKAPEQAGSSCPSE